MCFLNNTNLKNDIFGRIKNLDSLIIYLECQRTKINTQIKNCQNSSH